MILIGYRPHFKELINHYVLHVEYVPGEGIKYLRVLHNSINTTVRELAEYLEVMHVHNCL